ncbi:MAG: YihY/virulence factor BrkB family protein [Vicinamibacterales bacterium]
MANRERPGAGGRAADIARLTGVSAWRGLIGFYESDDLTHAAAIAYYALLSLFPFFLLLFSFFGWAAADADNRQAVLSFVMQYFPAQFDFITTQLDTLGGRVVTIGVAGTAALVWGALGVFGAISTAVNHAWGVQAQRGFWGHKLFSFLMLLVAGLLVLAALLLVSASHVVGTTWFAEVLMRFPGLAVLRSFALRNLTTALFILGVGFIYYFVPNTKVRFRDVWIGAFVTGLLWKGAFELFSWYISDMTRLRQVNGSIAAVVVFLVWVYVQAAILLYGVEFTAAYARLRGGATPAREKAPG